MKPIGRLARRIAGITLLIGLCAAGWAAPALTETFTEFEVPGATNTFAVSINDRGEVTGFAKFSKSIDHGFIRLPDGMLTSFDAPGARQTWPAQINGDGYIAGTYWKREGGRPHGFVRSPDGAMSTIDAPQSQRTYVRGMNATGVVIGECVDSITHGFLREPDGSIVKFDVPGAESTQPASINKLGAITGSWGDGFTSHGFIRKPDGSILQFDVPRASGTAPTTIDNAGRIAGYFERGHGQGVFVRQPNGKIVRFSVPNSKSADAFDLTVGKDGTSILVGSAWDTVPHYFGFLHTRRGNVATFEAPGSGTGPAQGTWGLAINAHKVVAGYYIDTSNISRAFIRVP